MAKILIAWELGTGYGHFARCLSLASGLVNTGHEVVLALQNIHLPWGIDVLDKLAIIPAPVFMPKQLNKPSPINFAGVLLCAGFDSSQELASRIRAWHGIFTLTQPDIVVCDYAPTAALSAHLTRHKYMSIGSGFAIPPDTYPWPSIRPWELISERLLLEAEYTLNAVTKKAQLSLGFKDIVTVRELYRNTSILDTFEEIDHYEHRNCAQYIGPVKIRPPTYKVSWNEKVGKKILAYLTHDLAGFDTIMAALQKIDAEVICVSTNLSEQQAKQLATARMRISLDPIDVSTLMKEADLVISYGSVDFLTEALLKGIPTLVMPRFVEGVLMSRRIQRIGAGTQFPVKATKREALKIIEELLNEPNYKSAAYKFSCTHSSYSNEGALKQGIAIIERLLTEKANW